MSVYKRLRAFEMQIETAGAEPRPVGAE
jgi:hypothetical protein